jgi:hypothetical protein
MEGHGLDHRASEPSASVPLIASGVPLAQRVAILEQGVNTLMHVMQCMITALEAMSAAQCAMEEGPAKPDSPESVH